MFQLLCGFVVEDDILSFDFEFEQILSFACGFDPIYPEYFNKRSFIIILLHISAFSFVDDFEGEECSWGVDFPFDEIELDEGEEASAIVFFVVE